MFISALNGAVSTRNDSGENSKLLDSKERVCGGVREYCYMYICSSNDLYMQMTSYKQLLIDDVIKFKWMKSIVHESMKWPVEKIQMN